MSEFDDWWGRRGEAVDKVNERRGGESGVERVVDPVLGVLYIKRQTGHVFRSFRYPLGKPTAIRERNAYYAFAKIGLKIPELVFVEARKVQGNWQAILVTKDLDGFITLKKWYLSGCAAELGVERHQLFLQKLGHALARLHKSRWCHGSLHFSHIYVKPGTQNELPEVAFIDLERAEQKFTVQQAAKRDFRTMRRRTPKLNGLRVLNEQDWSILLDAHQKALRAP